MSMFEYFRFRSQLRNLHKARKALSLKISEIEGSNTDYYESHPEISWHVDQEDKLDHKILWLQTNYFQRQLESRLVPMPSKENSEYWLKYDFEDGCGEVHILNGNGINHVKNLLQEEEKEFRERITFWISIIFGLIGAMTGLLSILIDK